MLMNPILSVLLAAACTPSAPSSPSTSSPTDTSPPTDSARPDPCTADEWLEVGLQIRDYVSSELLAGLPVSSCGESWTTDESGVVMMQLPGSTLAEVSVDGGEAYGIYRFAIELPDGEIWDAFAASLGGQVVLPKGILGTGIADALLGSHGLSRDLTKGRLFVAIGPEPDGVTGSVEGATAAISTPYEAALAQTGPLSSELGTSLKTASGDIVFVNVDPGKTELTLTAADESPCSLLLTWRQTLPWELEIEADVNHVVGAHCPPN